MFWKKRKQPAVSAGCGKLGARIAIALQQNAYEVTVIDVRRENFHRLPCDIRIKAIAADACDKDILLAAGIEHVDCFFAATGNDNLNAMLAQMAAAIYKCKDVYARIDDDSLKVILNQPNIHILCFSELILHEFEQEHFLQSSTTAVIREL